MIGAQATLLVWSLREQHSLDMRKKKSIRSKRLDAAEFIQDIRRRQENILWPNVLVGGRAADSFLWRGSAHPTMVQRTGGLIIGGSFSGLGLEIAYFALRDRSVMVGLTACFFCYIGFRLIFVAVQPRRRRKGNPSGEKR